MPCFCQGIQSKKNDSFPQKIHINPLIGLAINTSQRTEQNMVIRVTMYYPLGLIPNSVFFIFSPIQFPERFYQSEKKIKEP